MTSRLTIVMYHYVRDRRGSRYPRLKALETDAFRAQLDYFSRHHSVVRMEDVLAHVSGELDELPPRPVLLTFDDGYKEHFAEVLPALDERQLQGSFFPSAAAVDQGDVLEANKIQFVLAAVGDPDTLGGLLLDRIDAVRPRHHLPPRDVLVAQYGTPNRYDTAAVTLFKRLLQHGLPAPLRTEILHELFATLVTADEAAFAGELYVTVPELEEMLEAGMFVGSHGYSHCWLDAVSVERQRQEVDRALDFLGRIGAPTQQWVMCYPFGGHNASVVDVVRERGCALGLTTEVGIAELSPARLWTLPRLDTNDFPTESDAAANAWTCGAG